MLNWLFYGSGFGPVGYGYQTPYVPTYVDTKQDQYLNARLHSLELACAALWELLKAKYGYTDQELIDTIKKVDQTRAQSSVPTLGADTQVCPKCGHKMLTHNHLKCLWCGADLQGAPFGK